MAWSVTSVNATDFRTYDTLAWDLEAQSGITLIVGKRNGKKSNGSGKSSLFYAILYGLWGWLPKNVPADKVIRKGADSCSVSVTVKANGTAYTIERGRGKKGPFLNVSGFADNALVGGLQKAIDSLVGTCDMFMLSRMFIGQMSSFCRLGDAEKKSILEKMLRLDHYATAREVAAVALKEAADTVEELTNHKLPRAEAALDRVRDDRQKTVKDAIMHRIRLLRTWRKHRDAVFEEHAALCEAGKELSAWVRGEAERLAVSQRARNALENSITQTEDDLRKATDAINPVASALAVLNSKITEASSQIDDIRGNRHPDICPTCNQRWAHDHDPASLAAAVSSLETKVRAWKAEKSPLLQKKEELSSRVEELEEQLRQQKQELRSLGETVDHRKYRSMLASFSEAEQSVILASERLQQFEAENEEFPENQSLEELDARLEEAKAEVATIQKEISDTQTYADDLLFWKKAFSPGGIPSFLVDSSVPFLNATASKIADILTDGELSVSFDAAAVKGSKTVFKVVTEYAEGADSFENSSRGEQTRIDLSVLLAVSDLISSTSPTACEQLFFDEVMDGTDEHFAEGFVSMLRQHYNGKQVWIISHDPSIGNVCDRTMVVKKVHGVSRVYSAA